jgi:hypothetical protein
MKETLKMIGDERAKRLLAAMIDFFDFEYSAEEYGGETEYVLSIAAMIEGLDPELDALPRRELKQLICETVFGE